jgi:hypothetical protein
MTQQSMLDASSSSAGCATSSIPFLMNYFGVKPEKKDL